MPDKGISVKRIFLLISNNAFREAVGSVLDQESDLEVVLQAGSLADVAEVSLKDRNLDIALVDPALSDWDGMFVVR